MNAQGSLEFRAGQLLETPALVLSSTRYQETGKIVQILTQDFGRWTTYAPGAANSRRRFGASLEPMSFVSAQVRWPREPSAGGHRLIQLQKVDLRDGFLHLRKHSELLNLGLFVVKLIQETLPEHHPEPFVFRTAGRVFRAAAELQDPATQAPWLRLFFWSWLGKHMGLGDWVREWTVHYEKKIPASFSGSWERMMEVAEPDISREALRWVHGAWPALTFEEEKSLYRSWTERSGMHLSQWEKWSSSTLELR